jgi:hypothetical protein
MTPTAICEEIVDSYESQLGQGRGDMFNYFVKYQLTGMMNVIQDF